LRGSPENRGGYILAEHRSPSPFARDRYRLRSRSYPSERIGDLPYTSRKATYLMPDERPQVKLQSAASGSRPFPPAFPTVSGVNAFPTNFGDAHPA
jgi:hypothetical protein